MINKQFYFVTERNIRMAQNKKEKPNVSFKKDEPETGLRAIGNHGRGVTIKVNKKTMGYISAPNWQRDGWSIGIQIRKDEKHTDNNPNCPWKWIYFKQKFDTEAEARQYIKDHISDLNERFTFYYNED